MSGRRFRANMKGFSRNGSRKPGNDSWEIGFAALKKFRSREKHCIVPRGHEEETIKLGIWVNNQRYRASTLSIERKQRLDALQFVWHPYEISWEKGFSALQRFKSREKHCRVPFRHQEGGIRLGRWVTIQRSKRETLPTGLKRRLDAIDFVWDLSELAWDRGFAALKHFKLREGHCRVPRGHEEGNFKLGTWVGNQRNRKAVLSAERKRRLNAIGFVWRLR
jgi:hypothetical protein